MQKGRFLKNAVIMTASALLLRTIGMFFRVWLADSIGSEGMGLYQLIFSVYMLAATFATSGITTAVTRLIAEELECGTARSVKRILWRAVGLSLAAGIASTVLVVALADPISEWWIKDIRAARSLRILAFSLPFMGVSSCIRGYFVACRRVVTPTNAQLLEQLVRMGIIFLIIGKSAARGLEYACAAVLFGDTVAEAASCGFMYLGYLRDRRRLTEKLGARPFPPYRVTKKLVALSLPIMAGRYLTTTLRTVESLLVPDCLTRFGGSREQSVSQYGLFRGMAMPVIFFLSSFLNVLSTLLVPELSGALSAEGKQGVESPVRRCVHITLTMSTVIGGVLWLFGEDIGVAFYGNSEVGFYIRWLAPLVPLMYLESVVTGMLNGLDQQKYIFIYNVVDSALRIGLIVWLVPKYGIYGFLAVTYVSNLLTSVLCFVRLLKTAQTRFRAVDWVVRPLACTAAALVVARAAAMYMTALSVVPRALLESAVCVGVYLAMIYVTGGFKEWSAVRNVVSNKLSRKEELNS